MEKEKSQKIILWLESVNKDDLAHVGGKGANLGEMQSAGFPIPIAFMVTAHTFKRFLEQTRIAEKIYSLLRGLDVDDTQELQRISKKISEIIMQTPVPDEIKDAITEAYGKMKIAGERYENLSESALKLIEVGRSDPYVIVRSSATAEDLPGASFAGQQKTMFFVKGDEELLEAVKECWASLFTARAIFYRAKNNFDHEKVYLCAIVQKQLESEKAGVAFSIHPATGDTSKIIIEAGWGQGDAVVGGEINPDLYIVDKNSMQILEKLVREQPWMYIHDPSGKVKGLVKKNLSEQKAKTQILTEEQIIKLARVVKKIEDHYNFAQDIEWAVEEGRIHIVQSRPVTFFGKREGEKEKKPLPKHSGEPVLKGLAASPGVVSGSVSIIHSAEELHKIKQGDILVTEMTDPDFVPGMRRAAAIITNEGGLTAHAAIVSRELGIPCIVGTINATSLLKQGEVITVDGSGGLVFRGKVEVEEEKPAAVGVKVPISEYGPVTATKVYMNLGIPEKAKEYSSIPADGIGLMRIEFVITSYIGQHPNYMIEQGTQQNYIDKLAQGIAEVAKPFSPKPVIVRFSDFKTNEYRSLTGGEKYEPKEDNPMLGWRGCSRYISPDFEKAFRLECRAVKKVRDEMNLKNVWVMLPFVRNLWEVKKIQKVLEEEGLRRGEDFKLWLMAEVPSIVFLTEEFSELCDGFSIGSNDLTQLTLGVDRDSAKLGRMGYFDERDEAVKKAIAHLIKVAHRKGVSVSICGQAPSVYPEFCEFLVTRGIDSISVNPDVVARTKNLVASIEKKILIKQAMEEERKEAEENDNLNF